MNEGHNNVMVNSRGCTYLLTHRMYFENMYMYLYVEECVHVRTLWDVGTYVPTTPMCM